MSTKTGIWEEIAGGLLIAASFNPYTAAADPYLFEAGLSLVVSGVGTILAGNPKTGLTTTVRDPVAPWDAIYGEAVTGGVCVYANTWGDNDNMLDMVMILACHQCEAVDTLYFDRQRIQINTSWIPTTAKAGYSIPTPAANSGTTFSPAQQTININSITRDANGVVTVVLPQDIPYLSVGDMIGIRGVTGDLTYNGSFPVAQIISRVPVDGGPPTGTYILTFTYLSGGTAGSESTGVAFTKWPNYANNCYFEPMLGTQTLGETFVGMQAGTPWQGDGKLVTPASPLNAGGPAGQTNPWTNYCSLVGKTAVFLRFQYVQADFPQGLPKITFHVQGNNKIYDPRSSTLGDVSTYVYSTNAALCIADFLANGSADSAYPQGANAASWGFQALYGTDIPSTELIAAANICDAAIDLALGGTEPQWTCNGKFSLDKTRGEILENLLTSCAGRLVYSNGQFVIQPAQWVTPISTPYNLQTHSIAPMKWQPTGTIRDQFNGVHWTYISQYTNWLMGDGPYYAQDTDHGYSGPSEYNGDINMGADGGVRKWLNLQLPFTISFSMGQRVAKVELLRRRYWATGTFTCDMSAYQFVPLDIIQADAAYLGLSNTLLEVQSVSLIPNKGEEGAISLATELTVKATDSSIYAWSTEEELSPADTIISTWPSNTVQELVCYPWSPGYVSPLSGDAYEGVIATSFGIQPVYSEDASGNGIINLEIKGTAPINNLDTSIEAPQITCTGSGSGGSLAEGTYVIAVSARSAGSAPYMNTPYQTLGTSFVPSGGTGSITVDIQWGSGDVGADLYLALWTQDGYVFHWNQAVASSSSGSSTVTVTTFPQNTAGGVDPVFDHFGIEWQQAVHTGPWSEQVQAVTATTVTINCPLADGSMTTNQWAGYNLALQAKYSDSVEIPILYMPIASSTASDGSGNFVLTIGANSLSHTLPDLTTLLTVGDLVGVCFKPTFTSTSFTDSQINNPYYPTGASGVVEAGHVVCVMTGEDAGDVVAISGVSGTGNTTINLATSFAITPSAGDLVYICQPANVPQVPGASMTISSSLTGLMANPTVLNLAEAVWLFRVRTEDVNNNYGPDSLAPWRIVYFFGVPGTPGGLIYASTP